MEVPFADLRPMHDELRSALDAAYQKVMDNSWFIQGKELEAFEKEFAEYVGVKHCIGVATGLDALYLVLKAYGIGAGDEVITTPFTFIASGNSIVYTGAKPVFADIDLKTFTLDPSYIESLISDKTKAIMPVQLYGQSADMDAICDIAEDHDLIVIEDAAQAHGATYNGKKVGSLGDMACFSFYPTKNMTTSEGGMITTNNEEFVEEAHIFRAHGSRVKYHHDDIGYNFRMTDISAAIGLAQLNVIDEFNKKRNDNANYLNEGLSDIDGVITPYARENSRHVYHQYTICVEKGNRDDWIDILTENGIGTGVHYPIPLYNQPIYKKLGFTGSCPNAELAASSVISLPVHPSLTKDDLDLVIGAVKKASDKIA